MVNAPGGVAADPTGSGGSVGAGSGVSQTVEPSRLVGSVALLLVALGPIGVALLSLALIAPTIQPGLAFWDTAEFQSVPPLLGTMHATGFPAYTIFGWLASVLVQSFGEPAYRMNVFSALCIVAAASLAVILVRSLTCRPALGIAAGLIVGLTQVSWRIATHADAHSLHLALLALVLVLLVVWERRVREAPLAGGHANTDRWIVAAAAAYAVAVSNHSLALLLAPGILLFVFAVQPDIRERRGLVTRCVGVFAAVVAAFYLELPLRAGPFRAPLVYGHPDTVIGFLYVVSGAQFRGDLGYPWLDLPSKFHTLVDFTARELGPLAALLPIGFVATWIRHRPYALLTVPTLGLTCFFAISYTNADIERYYLGPLLIAVTWVAILADWFIEAGGRLLERYLARRTGERAGTGSFGRALVLDLVMASVIAAPTLAAIGPVGASVDESRDVIAQSWVDEILPMLAPNAVVISWWSWSTPLWYARDVDGLRTDITVIDDRTILDDNLGDVTHVIDAYLASRPVYAIRLPDELATLGARYVVEPLPDPIGSGIVRITGYQPGVTP